MLWFPLPVRVYLKPAMSKNFMVIAVAALEAENGVKKIVSNFVRLLRKKE
jgi:hypothetical protein